MEREGERAAVTCDGRLFHRRAAATGNALSGANDSKTFASPSLGGYLRHSCSLRRPPV